MPIGPELPPHLQPSTSTPNADEQQEEEEEEDYGPQLPPDLVAARSAPKPSSPPPPPTTINKRVIGPSFPTFSASHGDDSDDDAGPQPLPAGMVHRDEEDGVEKFLRLEESRRLAAEEAKKPKALQREEWMLRPPSASELLGNIDPTKLTKARTFNTSTKTAGTSGSKDMSLWTETPQERQQRLADEVAGRKKRAANAEKEMSVEEEMEARRKRKRDEEIRKGVDEHTRRSRGEALVDAHSKKVKADDEDEKSKGIWDHSRDMSLGGRLMDDSSRKKLLHDAKGLSSRFGTGSSGGYL